MKEFVTADQHFWHNNILGHWSRPFGNMNAMVEKLVRTYNSVVGEDDLVYWLGDVIWSGEKSPVRLRKILSRLHGRKVLVLGNHDRLNVLSYLRAGFSEVHTHIWMDRQGMKLLLVHDPAWAVYGSYMEARRRMKEASREGRRYRDLDKTLEEYTDRSMKLGYSVICGHMHGHLFQAGRIQNAGVDVWDFSPVPMEVVLQRLRTPKREDKLSVKKNLEAESVLSL